MRHSFVTAILFGLFSLTLCLARDGVIHNDVVWRDTAGNEIWCNGGHIVREGDVFWWVNTQHDFVVPVTGTEVTTHLDVGDRYRQWTKRGPGRNIFLPLVWENGEPVLRWHKDWKIDVTTGRFSAASE